MGGSPLVLLQPGWLQLLYLAMLVMHTETWKAWPYLTCFILSTALTLEILSHCVLKTTEEAKINYFLFIVKASLGSGPQQPFELGGALHVL